MAECYNVACQYCVGYQCRRTCTCDIRLEAGEYVKVVRCKDCKHRPIWEMGRIENFAEAPILDETTVTDFLKKPKKKTMRDYTCPYLWDAEGYYEMPEDDFFCKYGEK